MNKNVVNDGEESEKESDPKIDQLIEDSKAALEENDVDKAIELFEILASTTAKLENSV